MNKYENKMNSLGSRPLRHPVGPATDQVRTIERELDCNLPADYLEFLESYGCHSPDPYTLFSFLEPYPGGERGILAVFFGADPKGTYDLLANYKTYQGRMPREFLPIADDPGGNIICLAVKGPNKGAVYFWDHEEEPILRGRPAPDYFNVYLIGASFDDFIATLVLDEP